MDSNCAPTMPASVPALRRSRILRAICSPVSRVWALLLVLSVGSAFADDTICATCRLQISQQVTFERQAFNATMKITNGLSSELTEVQATIYFTDAAGGPVTATNIPSETGKTFFYEDANGLPPPTSVSGNGSASLGWLIIPSAGASGTNPNGTQYFVGATLNYTVAGKQQSVKVVPSYIYVQPQPLLTLDYFLPGQVYGRDPTSSVITPPIPFNLGVRVTNTGYGGAAHLAINSGQPVITDNPQGLAVQFLLLGASVNDAAVQPTLLADFGAVGAQQSSVARWVMTSSLSGQFQFSATFSHADSLGGAVTSLLTATHAHTLVHDILVDLPGRDAVRDFLANDGTTATPVYEVYESEGSGAALDIADESAGNLLTPAGQPQTYQITLAGNSGFIYARTADPLLGMEAIQRVVRSDGKRINGNNAWLSRTFNTSSSNWDHYFNIFDDDNVTGLSYIVVFGANPVPPVFGPLNDQLLVAGQVFHLTVMATDADGTKPTILSGPLPVGATLSASVDGTATLSWTPTLTQVGTYPVTFTAAEGTLSTAKTIRLTVGLDSKLATWKEKYWPGETDPTIVGDSANPTRDSLPNLLKYGLDLDPTQAEANSGIVVGTVQSGGHSYLTLTYVGRSDDTNLQFAVVGSNSPSGTNSPLVPQTQTVPVTQDGVAPNMQRVEVRDSQPIDTGAPQRFLKLQVTNSGS